MTLRKNIFLLLSLALLLTACNEGKPSETTTAPISTAASIATTAPTVTTVGTTALPVETAESYRRTAVHYATGDKLDFVHTVAYPKVNTGTPGAEALNAKIAAEYAPIIASLQEGENGRLYNISYNYAVCDGIISIHVDQYIGSQYTNDGAYRHVFYYDMANDRELTMEEYFAHFSLDENILVSSALWSYELGKAGDLLQRI